MQHLSLPAGFPLNPEVFSRLAEQKTDQILSISEKVRGQAYTRMIWPWFKTVLGSHSGEFTTHFRLPILVVGLVDVH